MSKQQYTLYWDKQRATMLAAEMEAAYVFDGAHREMPLEWAQDHPYGYVEISSLPPSQLSRSKILCSITPTHPPKNSALEILDEPQELILDQTDEPLTQALLFLNRHKDNGWYRMSVERRFLYNSSLYGSAVETVSLAGSWPGEIQWLYHGVDVYHDLVHYECWESDEQHSLEAVLYRHLTNQHRVYWVFEKRPLGLTKYRYYAKKCTWQSGWHGADTVEQLATLLEQKEFTLL